MHTCFLAGAAEVHHGGPSGPSSRASSPGHYEGCGYPHQREEETHGKCRHDWILARNDRELESELQHA